MAHDVFDDYHRAVDHHPEIERTQRQQVRWNFVQVQANRGEEQRKRNGQGDDQCPARITQKEKQDYRDQQHPFGEIFEHGVGGQVQ